MMQFSQLIRTLNVEFRLGFNSENGRSQIRACSDKIERIHIVLIESQYRLDFALCSLLERLQPLA